MWAVAALKRAERGTTTIPKRMGDRGIGPLEAWVGTVTLTMPMHISVNARYRGLRVADRATSAAAVHIIQAQAW
jgi:hypothetical protein